METLYVALGIACLAAIYFIIRVIRPKAESNVGGWPESGMGAQLVSVGLVTLGVAGISFLVKAFTG